MNKIVSSSDLILQNISRFHLSGPFIIGVAGGSCVGKTSNLLTLLQKNFEGHVSTLSMDDFQYGNDFPHADSLYRWDDPENFAPNEYRTAVNALKNKVDAEIPIFSLEKNKRVGKRIIKPQDVVITEGLYPFLDESEQLIDYKIYVETPFYGRFLRRIFRFVLESKISKPDVPVRHMLGPTYLAHQKYVKKQRETADIILKLSYSFEETFQKFDLSNISMERPKGDVIFEYSTSEAVLIKVFSYHKQYELSVEYKGNIVFIAPLSEYSFSVLKQIDFEGF